MKKFFYLLFAAMIATTTFTSCEDNTEDMTDTEITAAITDAGTYSGDDSTGDELLLRFVSSQYVMIYTEDYGDGSEKEISLTDFDSLYTEYASSPTTASAFGAGAWAVAEGVIGLVDLDGNTYTATVSDEGGTLTLLDASGDTFATFED